MFSKLRQLFSRKDTSYRAIKASFPLMVVQFADVFFQGNTIQRIEAREILIALLGISKFSETLNKENIPRNPINAFKIAGITNKVLRSVYPETMKKVSLGLREELDKSLEGLSVGNLERTSIN